MSRNDSNRRRFLKQTALLASVGTAGCASNVTNRFSSSDTTTTPDTSTPTSTATETPEEEKTPGEGEYSLETNFNPRERFGRPGELLDDFEDLSAWSAMSGRLEKSSKSYAGSQSAKLVGQDGSDVLVEYAAGGKDLSDTEVSMALRTTTPDRMAVNIRLVDVFGNSAVRSLRRISHIPSDPAWFRTAPGTFQTSGDALDLSQVQRVQVHLLNPTDKKVEAQIDDLRTHPKPDTGYVVLSWDDNRRAYYEDAAPINDRHGFNVSMATAPRLVGQGERFMTVKQLKERQRAGDEIVAHASVTLGFEDMSGDELDRKLRQNKKWLMNQGFEGGDTIVYPGNNFDATVLSTATNYHYAGGMNQAGDVNNTGVYSFDPLVMSRTIGWDLEIAKNVVDSAATHHNCGILNFHDFSLENTMDVGDYEELLNYIDRKSDVEVITLGELWEKRKEA
ncbi:MAG: polysaccharide deacetylase [Haloarculaceae archaeon]